MKMNFEDIFIFFCFFLFVSVDNRTGVFVVVVSCLVYFIFNEYQERFCELQEEAPKETCTHPILSNIGISKTFQPNFEEDKNIGPEKKNNDPRFSSFGLTGRGYIHSITGQPRFFYDDINSIRMPPLLSRSKIDIFNYSGESLDYKQFGVNEFTKSTVKFREDIQKRWLKRRNTELMQRKLAPISTLKRI